MSAVDPDRDGLVGELFSAACALPEAQWAAFLAERCDDEDLREEVLDLLRRDRRGTPVLDQPILDAAQRAALAPVLSTPETIAEYTVVRLIGRGSMGSVYEALQPGTGSRVAVKVLRTGIPSAALLHRFRREADLLARLEHKYIARIHESSSARLGPGEHPFIAMELVDGQPLDRHCRERGLDDRERIALLAKIGEGVDHAHSRGVLHRDLKPSNVLVDGAGQPRIIDFGVARAVGTDQQSWSVRTATGQLVGTLQYMSPEQVLGAPTEIDERADVYALGVIGFELLAGRPPYDVETGSLSTVLERIRNEDPPLLGAVRDELRGDIETIFARALEKKPDDRYASAAELVADLRASLKALPIAARRPGGFAQLRKFGERNPRVVLAAVAFVGVLLLGLGGSIWGWSAARDQEQAVSHLLAEQIELTRAAEEARSEALAASRESEIALGFYEDVMTGLQDHAGGADVRLRDLLVPLSDGIRKDFKGSPRMAAHLHAILGRAFFGVGDFERALVELESSIALIDDERDHVRLTSRFFRAKIWIRSGRLADAVDELEEVAVLYPAHDRELRAQVDATLLRALAKVGDDERAAEVLDEASRPEYESGVELTTLEILQVERASLRARRGELTEAEAELRAILEARRERLGPDNTMTLNASEHLADVLKKQGRFAEVDELLQHIVGVTRRRSGAEHPDTLRIRELITSNALADGRGDDVVHELFELVAISRRLHGEEHTNTARLMSLLGVAATKSGHPDALGILLDAIELSRSLHGPDDARLVHPLNYASSLRYDEQDFEGGVDLLREASRIARLAPTRSLGYESHLAVRLAHGLNQLGLIEQVERVARDALPDSSRVLGEDHEVTIGLVFCLAEALRQQSRWDEALEAYERFARADPDRLSSAWPQIDAGIAEIQAERATRGQ